MGMHKFRKIIASTLLFVYGSQAVAAAVPAPPTKSSQPIQNIQKSSSVEEPTSALLENYSFAPDSVQALMAQSKVDDTDNFSTRFLRQFYKTSDVGRTYPLVSSAPQNFNLSTDQLGITGPVMAGVDYSDLTGVYFNGQILKKINEALGFNILGEYGSRQYRLNGTIGFLVAAQTFFKVSAEQLAQKLPFTFSTGRIDQRMKQNAVGARLQRGFDIASLSLGGYLAQTPNKRLGAIPFVSNGSNCNGYEAGLLCINERNIAGGRSSGADLGISTLLNRSTFLEGRLYYDTVRYDTIFSPHSIYDKSGYGGGFYAQHLISPNLKLATSAEIRKIYDTYNVTLSWMPPFISASGTEFSLVMQHVQSHNPTPHNNSVGLKVTFFADRVNYQAPIYGLSNLAITDNIGSWISQPAVKMNQVLAVAEEYTHLADSSITSVIPNFGPITGGNTVTINGTNFPSGLMVTIGGNIATIVSQTTKSITVIAPVGNRLGGVPVSITRPDGKTTTYENGYTYLNGTSPLLLGEAPIVGPVTGGTSVTLTGANFEPGKTSVYLGNLQLPPDLVTVNSSTSLTFTAPPHPTGTVLVIVSTPAGPSGALPGGYTYVDAPIASSAAPVTVPTAGGTAVTVTGSSFVTGSTSVTVDGSPVPASSITVNSSTSLTFISPSHAAGGAVVIITTPGGSGTLTGGLNYSATAATATSLSPQYGSTAGGTQVTINGTNFESGTTSVAVDGTNVTPVNVISSNQLTITTDPHAAGNVSVTVTNSQGQTGPVPGGFNYVSPPTAASLSVTAGPTTGDTAVTITGSNFIAGNSDVSVDGSDIPQNLVTVNSSTSLTFITEPNSAGNVSISVSTPGGDSGDVPGGFDYQLAPTATSLSAQVGSSVGGTVVVAHGTNFVAGSTSIAIGSAEVPPAGVTVNSSTTLTFMTPAHPTGTVAVVIATPGGDSNDVPGGFTFEGPPTATAINPASGPVAGEIPVTITGSGFSNENTTVMFGSHPIAAADITVNSATSLTFETPPNPAGNVQITVTTPGGTSTPSLPGGFTYESMPTAASLDVTAGPVAGGTVVTITGSNFVSGDTSVKIDDDTVLSSSVTVNSPTSLTFNTPAHAAGNVSVSVVTGGGTTTSVAGGFTFLDSPAVASLNVTAGSTLGGNAVTITGNNFVSGSTIVQVGGADSPSVTVNSPTSLTFITPANSAGSADVIVTTPGGSTTITGGFTYEGPPTVTGIDPPFGPSGTSTTNITLTGTNFITGQTSVAFGSTTVNASSVTVNSPTSLTFPLPADAAGNVIVNVTTPGGTSANLPGGFTYVDAPTATSLDVTLGSVAGGTSVTITGTNFVAGNTSVLVQGQAVATPVVVNSASSLTFVTEPGTAGNVTVQVETAGGTSAAVPGGFTYVAIPTVISATPPYALASGGTTITLSGTGFIVGGTQVSIGDQTLGTSQVNVTGSGSLTFTAPGGTAESVNLSVITVGGTSSNLSSGFIYEDVPTAGALSVNTGPAAGGTVVTLTGTGFVPGDTFVIIGSEQIARSNVTVNSPTSLTFTTTAQAAGTVNIQVGNTSATGPIGSSQFTFDNAPTITQISPLFGNSSGGDSVTLTGTGFVANATTVSIGNGAGSLVVVNSPTSLTFDTPPGAAGNVTVNVTSPGGTSNNVSGGFTYVNTPVVNSVSTTLGTTAGGTSVTLSGSNFVAGNTSVTVGGVSATSVVVNSSTSLTFVTPGGSAGVAILTVTSAAGDVNVPGGFTYVGPPTATQINPTAGTSGGGTSVSITGSGFITNSTSITIGGDPVPAASVNVLSDTSLSFSTPAHAAGNATVIVTTPGGDSNSIPGGYLYEDPLVVGSLSTTLGSTAGGTSVTLTGNNFIPGGTNVTVGGIPALSVVVNSSTSLTFVTPGGSAGAAIVNVGTAAGNLDVPGGFTYVGAPTATQINPAAGSSGGGTPVTITGSGFIANNTSITMGGTPVSAASVNVLSDTSLSFSTPAHAAGNATVIVTTPGGDSNSIPGGYLYEDALVVGSLSTTMGASTGGTSVTLTGSNFIPGGTTVTVGGIPATSVVVNSSTSLTFVTPAGSAGLATVTVGIAAGSVDVAGGFTYVDAPTVTAISDAFGAAGTGPSVTLTGTNFVANNTSIAVDGTSVASGAVTVNSPTSLTFDMPNNLTGNVTISVITPGGTSLALPGGFTYVNPPTATSLSKAFGPVAGGTSVTITGTNFVSGNTSVTIGSITYNPVDVIVNSSTSLTIVTKLSTTGAANLTVTVFNDASVTSPIPGGFTYEDVPTVTGASPTFVSATTGATVTVAGTGFVTNDTALTVGGTPIPVNQVTVISPTSLSFFAQAGGTGSPSIIVSTSGGDSGALPNAFTYVSAPTISTINPLSGPSTVSIPVTLTGTNFIAGNTTVSVDNVQVPAGSVTINSPTSLTFYTQTHPVGTGQVRVSNVGGESDPIVFTFDNTVPTTSTISPAAGSTAGQIQVTITGTNFVVGGTTVNVDGSPVSGSQVTVDSTTSLHFTNPSHAAGNVNVSVTTTAGDSNMVPGGFTYEDVPVATSISPNSGSTTGNTQVTITGANFVAGTTTVNVNSVGLPTNRVTVNSPTSLTFTTDPNPAGNVSISVTNAAGRSPDIPGGFTYNDTSPTITSIGPIYGPLIGNTSVTLTGTNFVAGATSVNIGSDTIAASSVNVISPTVLTFTTLPHAAGNVNVSVTTSSGTSAFVPGGFTYLDVPTAATITPLVGSTAGGGTVTISGSNFIAGYTDVLIGSNDVLAAQVTVNSPTSLSFTLPTSALTGNVTVQVRTPGGTSTALPGGFTYEPVPTITTIAPPFGPALGGTHVTITGTGFIAGDTQVNIGQSTVLAGQVTVDSSTSLRFDTPVGVAGNVALSVKTSGGTSNTISNGFLYEDPPTVGSLSVTVGPASGGTLVTLTGTNFVSGNTTVNIGGLSGLSVNVSSSTTLTFITPSGLLGNVDVYVVTDAGTSSNVSGGFTFEAVPTVSSVSPPFGNAAGNTQLTITGTGFVATDTTVNIGQNSVAPNLVTVNSPTSLTVLAPASTGSVAGSALISVSTSGGGLSNTLSGFTYVNAPTIVSLNVNSGPTAGGTIVTITGTNFVSGNTKVIIGSTTRDVNEVTVNSSTSLTFTTPPNTAGSVDVTVSNAGGSSLTLTNGFTYADIPTATLLAPPFGKSIGNTPVQITGSNFITGLTTVNVGGIPATNVVVNSATSLTWTTDPHVAGNVTVNVSTPGGTTSNIAGGFTYEDPPTAILASPAFGPIVGNTNVTITGTNFVAGDTQVTLGSDTYNASQVTVNSPTSISFTTRTSTAGNQLLKVITSGGDATVPSGFTYEDVPTAVSLDVTSGIAAGGTPVTITGTNFVAGDTRITVGGASPTQVTVNSSTSVSFVTPAHAAGNVAVTVTTSAGSVNVPGGFTYIDAPTATLLTPASGSVAGGTTVTITGTNFVAGGTTIKVDGATVNANLVTVISPTTLTFITPLHVAGNVSVNVSNIANNVNVPGGFTYIDIPTATAINQPFGSALGGTQITLTGTNFIAGATSIIIGGNPVSSSQVTVNSSTSLTFTTPAHVAGNVGINVVTIGGTSTSVPGGFTYENAPTASLLAPVFGPITGGTIVTVTGTNFVLGDTHVALAGTPISDSLVTVNNSTSLTFITPSTPTPGNVTVSVFNSANSSGNIMNGFTYEAPPVVSGINTPFGTKLGGTPIVLTGNNFVAGDTSVFIGANYLAPSSVTVNSPTSLSFNTPVNAAGNVTVSVMTTGGGASNSLPGGFTYEDVPTATSLTPAFGSTNGGTIVSITGSNFVVGDTQVLMAGAPVNSSLVTVNSSTSLTLVTPQNSTPGNLSVQVKNSAATTAPIGSGFTYELPPTATSLITNLGTTFGSSVGGSIVTITGTNFVAGDTKVSIGNSTLASNLVTVNSSTSLSFTTPPQTAGNVAVNVITSGGTSTAIPGGFTYEDPPTATSLSPLYGPINGTVGTLITVTGTNFAVGDTKVQVGSTLYNISQVAVNSPTSLSFNAPISATVGNVPVTVITSAGSAVVPGGFTYELPPTATSISQAFGPASGGTSITIIGTNFVAGDTKVSIGSTVLNPNLVTVNSPTSLTFATPAQASGNVAVTVITSGGTSTAIAGGFTYEDPPTATSLTPAFGPVTGNTSVNITGTGFVSGDTIVTFGGVSASSVRVNSSTSLTAVTPARPVGNAIVNITTKAGSPNVPGGFTFELQPTITSISPTSGTTAGGTPITVTGTNFVSGDTTVSVGGTPATSVTVNSPTSLTFATPTLSAGTVAVSVSTSGGTSNTANYTYLAPSMTSCTAALPSIIGVQLVTCVGANLTLFQTTFLKASGSAACSTFPTQAILPSINLLGQVLITANVPSVLTQGLIGCNIQVCSNSSCSVLGGVTPPVLVKFSL